jgi:hypothetical protein
MKIDEKILNEIARYRQINKYILEQDAPPVDPTVDPAAAGAPPVDPTADLRHHQHQQHRQREHL